MELFAHAWDSDFLVVIGTAQIAACAGQVAAVGGTYFQSGMLCECR